MTRIFAAALTSALSLAASSAMAFSNASVSIGDVSFTVIDLAPTDGIAPSFRFLSQGPSIASTSARYFSVAGPEGEMAFSPVWSADGNGLSTLSIQAAAADGSVSGDLSIARNALSVQAEAAGYLTSYFLRASDVQSASNSPPFILGLEVSARTLVLMSVTASASVSVGHSLCGTEFLADDAVGPCSNEYGVARASLSVYSQYQDNVTFGSSSFNDTLTASAATGNGTWGPWLPDGTAAGPRAGYDQSQLLKTTWTVAMTNPSQSAMRVGVSMSAQVIGAAMSAPVPEAGSTLMSLAGLAVAGALIRRRRV